MLKQGDLYQSVSESAPENNRWGPYFAEVIRTWNHRDIDSECPESVAIVGMVEVVVLSRPDVGKKRSIRTNRFFRNFKYIEEAK